MSAVVVASLRKNARERIRVALDSFKGTDLCDIRVTVELSGGSGVWVPTGKGVAFNRDLLREVIEALQEAERVHLAGEGR